MKNFLLTFVAVLLAAGLALFAYDRFVLGPRLQSLEGTERVALTEARQEARQIAAELDAEVDRSVTDAKAALDEQAASEARLREIHAAEAKKIGEASQATEALMRASMLKVMVSEYYMSEGQWPRGLADLGQNRPADFAGGPVALIDIEPEGVIAIAMRPDVAAGASLRLVPSAKPSGLIDWTCRATNYPAAARLPACR
jgi:hypothetical protein